MNTLPSDFDSRMDFGTGLRPARFAGVAFACIAVFAGCGDTATAPGDSDPFEFTGDPAAGQVAFVQSCSQCHNSRDGYDLAAFGFSKLNVFRRSLAHVDEKGSRDIAVYIETLQPGTLYPRVPFQPSVAVGSSDQKFWEDAIGATGWPETLTPDDLREIDVRSLRVPLAMPAWSIEDSNEDWMPDVPLPAQVLDYANGALRNGLDAYYADPTDANLLRVIAPFKPATEGHGLICWEDELDACFEARRWIASLGAQHYLRRGQTENIPVEVARTWWDVGTTAVSLKGDVGTELEYEGFDRVSAHFPMGARWTYLAYSYYPDSFIDESGYMGTFLESQNLRRTAVVVALKRMVGDGPAHQENIVQFIDDGTLAIRAADYEVGPGVSEFVFQYLVDQLEARGTAGMNLVETRELIALAYNESLDVLPYYSAQHNRVTALRDRVMELLQ